MKNAYLKLRRLAAILLGVVFLVSGLLKIEDPVGTMLIVTEYLKFFHMAFLVPAAKVLGILLGSAEALLGVALITGVLRVVCAWAAGALVLFFTFITLLLYLMNPEMDCGCFGEAVHLTHAQSFWKNVVLLALALLAFLPPRHLGKPRGHRRVAAVLGALSVVFAIIYSNTHLPIADYTAFDLGAELMASLDDDIEADNHYMPAFIYEKDGQQGTFSLNQLPDSSWTFVRADTLFRPSVGMRKDHPILSFRSAEGDYLDAEAAQGRVVVFSVYHPEKARWNSLLKQYRAAEEAGAKPLVLVSATPETMDRLGVPIEPAVYYADYKTLITLNRSNGGASYFADGELVAKWHARAFPKDLQAALQVDPVDLSTRNILKRRIQAQGFCLYLAAILILL